MPLKCINQILRVIEFEKWQKCFVCCSGTFRLERILSATFPGLKIYSNDVSLFSSTIGRSATREPFEIRFEKRLDFIEQKFAKMTFADRVAAVHIAFQMSRFSANNLYSQKHFQYFVDNFETLLPLQQKKISEAVEGIRIKGYFAGDWREQIERAMQTEGAGIVAFPPFFKAGYERQFKFIDENIRWDSPPYEIYDPKDLEGIVDWIDASGTPFFIISNQRFNGHEPSTEFTKAGRAAHFGYTNTQKSSLVCVAQRSKAFLYMPIRVEELSESSLVKIVPIEPDEMNYLKDCYLSKKIKHVGGMWNFAVFVDEMLVGGIILSLDKFNTRGKLYLLSDFSINRAAKLSKLVAMLATSREVVQYIDKKRLARTEKIATTAFSNHPVSMKYRGIF
ncbi:MAG: hypothetical protein ABIE92_14490, partial [bacterium]